MTGLWFHPHSPFNGHAVGPFRLEIMRYRPQSPGMSDQNTQPTLLTAWKGAQARLKAAGIDSPSIDARLMLEAATGAGRVDILNDPYRALSPEQTLALDAMVDRR